MWRAAGLFLVLVSVSAGVELQGARRHPRLFYISTSASSTTTTTTSTLTTNTYCYTTAGAAITMPCRKKRYIVSDPFTGDKIDLAAQLKPTKSQKKRSAEALEPVIESAQEPEAERTREGKFLLYWLTTTTTTTSTTTLTTTSYSSTITFTATNCSPTFAQACG